MSGKTPVYVTVSLVIATALAILFINTAKREDAMTQSCCQISDEKDKLDDPSVVARQNRTNSLEIMFGPLSETLTTLEKPDQDRYVNLAFDIAKHDLVREDADFPHKEHAAVWKEDGIVNVWFLSRSAVEKGIMSPGDEPYAIVYFDWPSGKAIRMVDRRGNTVELNRSNGIRQ